MINNNRIQLLKFIRYSTTSTSLTKSKATSNILNLSINANNNNNISLNNNSNQSNIVYNSNYGYNNSLYKVELPESLIEFSSKEGKELFKDALLSGYMEGYFPLAEQFLSQSDPSFCGVSTLTMILNSLKIGWFTDEMLDCCIPIESIKRRGITFTEFSCLARCNGANIISKRGNQSNLDQFRNDIIKATTNKSIHLVVLYSRKVMGQTGLGHYSPIGGYHKERDLVLILDVARFKYSSHWVPLETLWSSINDINPFTNKSRGYYLLSSTKSTNTQNQQTINMEHLSNLFKSSLEEFSQNQNQEQYQSLHYKKVVELYFKSLPISIQHLVYGLKNSCKDSSLDMLFKEVENHSKSFQLVKELIDQGRVKWNVSKVQNENYQLATLLFLVQPSSIFKNVNLSIEIRTQLADIRNLDSINDDVILQLLKLRYQLFK